MAQKEIIAGVRASIAYADEGYLALGTSGSPLDTPFGYNNRITDVMRRNFKKGYGTGRNFKTMAPMKIEGNLSVECDMTNGWWLRYMLGSFGSTAWTGSPVAYYTHEYAEADHLPSMTIGYDHNLTTDSGQMIFGGVMESATLTATLGEPVRARFEIPYANKTRSTTLQAAGISESYEPMTFAGATLNVAGSTIAEVQSMELAMTQGGEMVWGIGSQVPTNYKPGARTYSVRATTAFKDTTEFLDRICGNTTGLAVNPDPTPYLTIKYDQGGSGTNQNILQFNLGSAWVDENTIPSSPEDMVVEDVVMHAMYCGSATYVNGGSPALGR